MNLVSYSNILNFYIILGVDFGFLYKIILVNYDYL